jgi:hypothetical protein
MNMRGIYGAHTHRPYKGIPIYIVSDLFVYINVKRITTHYRAHCHTLTHTDTHCLTHCHTLPSALPHTDTRTARTLLCTPGATYCRSHCRTVPHCRTSAHCRAHCHTLPISTLPHTATHTTVHTATTDCCLHCHKLSHTAGQPHNPYKYHTYSHK